MSLINDALKRAKAATPVPPPDLQFRPVGPLKPVPLRRGWSWSATLGVTAAIAVIAVFVLLRRNPAQLMVRATTPTEPVVKEVAATPAPPPVSLPPPEPKPAVHTPPAAATTPSAPPAPPERTLAMAAPARQNPPAPVVTTDNETASISVSRSSPAFKPAPGANAPHVSNPVPVPVAPPAKPTTSQPLAANPPPVPAAITPTVTPDAADINASAVRAITSTNEPAPPLRLQAIVFHPTRPSAIIGGRSVFIGDPLGNQRVVAISQETVTLAGAGRTNVLSLP